MRTKTNRERNNSFKKEDKFNTKKVKFANKITEITSTIKYFLLRNINIKNAYILSALVISLVMLGGSYSYAMFTASVEKKGALNMVVGNLYSFIDSSDLTSAKTITPIIKPDVKGWLNVKLSNIYTSIVDNMNSTTGNTLY